jgi:hypothetical protein
VNERDEVRVIEALQALTGGLTVTEEDIVTAGGRLHDHLGPPSPRRRLPLLVAAAAALLVVIGYLAFQTSDRDGNAAPPVSKPTHTPADDLRSALQADAYSLPGGKFTSGAPPSYQDLAGFWLLRVPYGYTMFVEGDGDWQMGAPNRSWIHGDSTLNGTTWTQRLAEGGDCYPLSRPWRTRLAADGSLRLELKLASATCTPADNREVWDRVAPGSPVADYLLAEAQAAQWQAAPDQLAWQGLYVSPGTGHLLEVSNTGHYRYYDTLTGARLAAADRGDLELADGTLTGSCAGGSFSGGVQTGHLAGVDGYVETYRAIRINTSRDGCRSIAQGIWVQVLRD